MNDQVYWKITLVIFNENKNKQPITDLTTGSRVRLTKTGPVYNRLYMVKKLTFEVTI